MVKDEFVAYNDERGWSDKVAFFVRDWGLVAGGAARPQAKINRELEESDFVVVMLWDRWGSPTGSDVGHSSGTQEEFELAVAALADVDSPIREVLLLFKAIGERRMQDPGPQLAQVLKFRSMIEEWRVQPVIATAAW